MKLPCCDNSVCGDCECSLFPHTCPARLLNDDLGFQDLDTNECPTCTHSPFSKETCSPAKSLQTTIKVFLKNEAKKRGIDLKTGQKQVPEAPTPTPAPAVSEAVSATPAEAESTPAAANVEPVSAEAPLQDQALPSENEAVPTTEVSPARPCY